MKRNGWCTSEHNAAALGLDGPHLKKLHSKLEETTLLLFSQLLLRFPFDSDGMYMFCKAQLAPMLAAALAPSNSTLPVLGELQVSPLAFDLTWTSNQIQLRYAAMLATMVSIGIDQGAAVAVDPNYFMSVVLQVHLLHAGVLFVLFSYSSDFACCRGC